MYQTYEKRKIKEDAEMPRIIQNKIDVKHNTPYEDVRVQFHPSKAAQINGAAGVSVVQFTKATITVIDGENRPDIYSGPDVEAGDGKRGGIDHAEQQAWELAKSNVVGKLQKGKSVRIIFEVTKEICSECCRWFEGKLCDELDQNIKDNGRYEIIVRVKGTDIVINRDNTIWTKETAEKPTTERLSEYDRLIKFVTENRDEEGNIMQTSNNMGNIGDMLQNRPDLKDSILQAFENAKATATASLAFGYGEEIIEKIEEFSLYKLMEEISVSMAQKDLYDICVLWKQEKSLEEIFLDVIKFYIDKNYETDTREKNAHVHY